MSCWLNSGYQVLWQTALPYDPPHQACAVSYIFPCQGLQLVFLPREASIFMAFRGGWSRRITTSKRPTGDTEGTPSFKKKMKARKKTRYVYSYRCVFIYTFIQPHWKARERTCGSEKFSKVWKQMGVDWPQNPAHSWNAYSRCTVPRVLHVWKETVIPQARDDDSLLGGMQAINQASQSSPQTTTAGQTMPGMNACY